jgi:hypothetical protein
MAYTNNNKNIATIESLVPLSNIKYGLADRRLVKQLNISITRQKGLAARVAKSRNVSWTGKNYPSSAPPKTGKNYPSSAPSKMMETTENITKLCDMVEKGLLSTMQFEAAKTKVLV